MKSFFFNCTQKLQFSGLLEQITTYNGSDSIPNGIGFGGRVNHFGLFISARPDLSLHHIWQSTSIQEQSCICGSDRMLRSDSKGG